MESEEEAWRTAGFPHSCPLIARERRPNVGPAANTCLWVFFGLISPPSLLHPLQRHELDLPHPPMPGAPFETRPANLRMPLGQNNYSFTDQQLKMTF